tara:strand:- start:33 stop:266 length:234 start_codon:yes stop_codon:yes gene_type:complete
MELALSILKNTISKLKIEDKLKDIFKDNRLLMFIIVANIIVYLVITFLSTFFKLPIILFVGTTLGIWMYMKMNNKKV